MEGLEAAETLWERGVFIPEGSPDDPTTSRQGRP